MIDSLTLQNYKCFSNKTVDFKEMTILAGTNGAGKSTIIQGIRILDEFLTSYKPNIRNALGLSYGSPKNLISQNRENIDDGADFAIEFSCQNRVFRGSFTVDSNTQIDLIYNTTRNGNRYNQVLCYVCADRIGPQMYYDAQGNGTPKPNGEDAASIAYKMNEQNVRVSKALSLSGNSNKFLLCLEEWLSWIFGNVKIDIKADYLKAQTEVKIGNLLVDEMVFPSMTGFGISYVLPIIIAGLWCSTKKGAVLLVENPEAHLHPAAQSRMGSFLQRLSSNGVQVIVETHSEHIIDGARLQAYCDNKTDNICIKFFTVSTENSVVINDISIENNGDLSEWPEGFFDQKMKDLQRLILSRR